MDDSEIIGGFEALFGAMSPEQEARITAYLRARICVGPSHATVADGLPVENAFVPGTSASAGVIRAGNNLGLCVAWDCLCKKKQNATVGWSDLRDIAAGRTPPGWRKEHPHAGFLCTFPGSCTCEHATRLGIERKVAEQWLRSHGQDESTVSADDVATWLDAQGSELPDAVMKAIAAATIRRIKAKSPPVPFPPPYDFLRDIPPPPMKPISPESWRHIDDWFRKNQLPQEPHGFGKQWVGVAVGTTTGDSSIAQQPPATQTIGGFAASRQYELMGVGASLDASDDRLAGITAPYSDDVGPIGGVFK